MNTHFQAQIWRFVRLFVMAFATTGVLTKGSYSHDAIVAGVVGALETAYREMSPSETPS